MRWAIGATGLVLLVLVLHRADVAPISRTAAQTPASDTEVDPKILAFLRPVETAPDDSDLAGKLKERHNVAVQLLEHRLDEYKRGLRDIGPLFEAARLTADSKLELAEEDDARIGVLEEVLGIAQLIEDHLQTQLDKGFGSEADLSRARYARLGVEVELLRARQPK